MLSNTRAKILSIDYRFIRRTIINLCARRPRDLEQAIIIGDSLNSGLMNSPLRNFFKFSIPKNIGVSLFDLKFPSPLIAASFKDDIDALFQWQLLGLGGITYKTVLKAPSEGNKRPRIQEIQYNSHYGLINSLGLPTKGLEYFVSNFDNKRILSFDRPVGISIGGNSLDEYLDVFNKIHLKVHSLDFKKVFYEVNISCPNTQDGKCLSDNLADLSSLIRAIRSVSSNVVIVKVSPDSSDEEVLNICELLSNSEKCAINVGNTKYVSAQSVGLNANEFSEEGGGLSGIALFENTLKRVELVHNNSKIPIIATGGIMDYNQVKAVRDKGAILIGMATQLVNDPFKIPQINAKLSHAS
ncbi:MAG: nitronate monooxygenase [Candidatus Neomarinimicrobiota bacterium]|nr:nitronate monooxygenase [Candidatus Neomarinimicrobiota bacterium]